jgi:hypothetical protein
MKIDYSILVNTCDKFDDCWDPFFKLWSIYWPNCKGKVYLNTEYKEYSYDNLDIVALQVCKINNLSDTKRATWSQCFKWALNQIDTDVVLYMQEDYFLKAKVKNEIVEDYVRLMLDNQKIKCIHLTDQSVKSNGKSHFNNLDSVAYNQRYRACCQAALWRKTELLDLIREYEDAWEFEEFGSMRSAILKQEYFVVDRSFVKLNQFEIIPYVFTGIVQGRWFEEVVSLFKKHDIEVDFSKRGFVIDAPPKPLKKRIQNKLNKIPKIIRNKIELISLKNIAN